MASNLEMIVYSSKHQASNLILIDCFQILASIE